MAKQEYSNGGVGRNTGQEGRWHTAVVKKDVAGPIRQSHRNKLGQADGTTDPNGVGNPSRVPSTEKPGVPGW